MAKTGLKHILLLGRTVLLVFALIVNVYGAVDERPWPDFPCHALYDAVKQGTFRQHINACKEGSHIRKDLLITSAGAIMDPKACVLFRMNGIVVNKEDKSLMFTDNKGLRRTLLTIFMGLFKKHLTSADNTKREAFVEGLIEKSGPCKKMFHDLAVVQKLPSSEWAPFYDCVGNAWKCDHQ